MLSQFCPDVRTSGRHTEVQSKTAEARIMQLSPQGSPMTIFPCRTSLQNSKGNIGSERAKYDRGMNKKLLYHRETVRQLRTYT